MEPRPRWGRSSAGFTLAELLVVVVVMGVLAAVAVPRIINSEGRANLASARSDARNMAVNVESALTDLIMPDDGYLEYNATDKALEIYANGQADPVYTIDSILTTGATMPAEQGGNGNNTIDVNGNYCIAVAFQSQTAYFSRDGFLTSCLPDSAPIATSGGGGGGSVGSITITKTFLSPYQTDPAVNWKSVAYGNGMYVAVGESATFATSPSGLKNSWTTTQSFTDITDATGVAAGRGIFVAIGSDRVVTSANPTTGWTEQTVNFPVAAVDWSLTYGAGKFVAVGGGKFLMSEDGENWTAGDVGGPVTKVAYASGKFLAIVGTGGSRDAFTSTDGETWTAAADLPDPGTGEWLNVSSANGMFYLTGSDTDAANLSISANASSWTTPALPSEAVWAFAIGGSGITYLIPANGTTAMKSSDLGSTWTAHGLVQPKPWMAGATDRNGVVTLVGDSGWTITST